MDDLTIAGHVVSAAAIEESFDTSGGPGGQHANRNETSVRLRLTIAESGLPADVMTKLEHRFGTHLEVTASDSRSQYRNRALARQRLKERIEESLVPETPRRRTKPSKASKKRRLEEKKARSQTKRLRKRPDPDD